MVGTAVLLLAAVMVLTAVMVVARGQSPSPPLPPQNMPALSPEPTQRSVPPASGAADFAAGWTCGAAEFAAA